MPGGGRIHMRTVLAMSSLYVLYNISSNTQCARPTTKNNIPLQRLCFAPEFFLITTLPKHPLMDLCEVFNFTNSIHLPFHTSETALHQLSPNNCLLHKGHDGHRTAAKSAFSAKGLFYLSLITSRKKKEKKKKKKKKTRSEFVPLAIETHRQCVFTFAQPCLPPLQRRLYI